MLLTIIKPLYRLLPNSFLEGLRLLNNLFLERLELLITMKKYFRISKPNRKRILNTKFGYYQIALILVNLIKTELTAF